METLIPLRSLNATDILNKLKQGELTPETALHEAFPSPFTKVSDVSIDNLQVEPLDTGLSVLNEHLVLKKDRPELVVVGAGTSHGKSAFMAQASASIAKSEPVFMFSLEMDERDIKARLLAPIAKTPLSDILGGKGNKSALKTAHSQLDHLQLYICCNGKRDVNYISQSAYDGAKRYGKPGLIVCDYLQLMRGPTKNTRTAEIAEILGTLKELAKGLKCPVLIGSQLNRECERRGKQIELKKGIGDYRPIKSDLMDSGSIEHDADVIMFISRQYVYDRTRPGEADFIIAKNRNGKLYNGILGFKGEYCSFYEETGI
jgi:replicative DNA helicase